VTGRRPSLRVVAAAATAGLLLVLVWSLSKSGHHRTGSNGVPAVAPVTLPGSGELCQGDEYLPPGTGRLRFVPRAEGGEVGPFEVRLLGKDGAVLRRDEVPARDFDGSGAAAADFDEIGSGVLGATVCIRNAGGEETGVIGEPVPGPPGSARRVPGPNPAPPPWIRMRLDYASGESETWWSFAGTVAERFGLVKATFFGAWTFWVAFAALLALAVGTIWWAARELRR
jgi:hypothetical protein